MDLHSSMALASRRTADKADPTPGWQNWYATLSDALEVLPGHTDV